MYHFTTENRIRELCNVDLSETTLDKAKSNLETAVKLASRDFIASPLDSEDQCAKRIIAKITAYQQIIAGYQKLTAKLYLTGQKNIISEIPEEISSLLKEYIQDEESKETTVEQLYDLIKTLYGELKDVEEDLRDLSGVEEDNQSLKDQLGLI